MPIATAFDATSGIHVITIVDDVTLDVIKEAADAVYASVKPGQPFRTLWDLQGMDAPLTTPDITGLMAWVRARRPGGGKTAVVARTDVKFGMSRQAEAYVDLGEDIAVFRTRDAALEWLVA